MSETKRTTFAIIIPTYNEGEKNIRRCFESIISQRFTDWEVFVCDDNSDDNTQDIVMEYVDKDPRFHYIKSSYKHYDPDNPDTFKDKDMSGISNMINLGIQLSDSKYILRMDMDDSMINDRIQVTYDYMEANPQCDMCGFPVVTDRGTKWEHVWGYQIYDREHSSVQNPVGPYTFIKQGITNKDCFTGPKPWHPTLCMRRDTVMKKMPYLYRQPFDGCEDTVLYHAAVSHGCRLDVIDTLPLVDYQGGKKHPTQGSIHENIWNVYNPENWNKPTNKMTVVIGFKNEGMEVEKTVISLRYCDKNINILLIDDASDDGYDYKTIAERLGCEYHRNETSLGCAGARNEGVKYVQTPYFILMDAHMRLNLTDMNWSERFVKELDKDPNQIIHANTIIVHSNTEEDPHYRHYTNEDCIDGYGKFAAKAACHNFQGNGHDWESIWCYKLLDNNKYKYTDNHDKDLCVPCISIMGATYATSVSWWNKIHGLDGLIYWGHDEPWMSLKSWLLGGKCSVFPNWGIGHIYRDVPSYGPLNGKFVSVNTLMLQYIMSKSDGKSEKTDEEIFNEYLRQFKEEKKQWPDFIQEVISIFNERKPIYDEIKEWLWSNAVHDVQFMRDLHDRLE